MEHIKIITEVKLATDIREFVDPMLIKRRVGMVYYQRLSDGGFIPRALSEETETMVLINQIKHRQLYIPTEKIIAENT